MSSAKGRGVEPELCAIMSFYSLTVKNETAHEPKGVVARLADEVGLAGLLIMGLAIGGLVLSIF
jgi:hypothetical protein